MWVYCFVVSSLYIGAVALWVLPSDEDWHLDEVSNSIPAPFILTNAQVHFCMYVCSTIVGVICISHWGCSLR